MRQLESPKNMRLPFPTMSARTSGDTLNTAIFLPSLVRANTKERVCPFSVNCLILVFLSRMLPMISSSGSEVGMSNSVIFGSIFLGSETVISANPRFDDIRVLAAFFDLSLGNFTTTPPDLDSRQLFTGTSFKIAYRFSIWIDGGGAEAPIGILGLTTKTSSLWITLVLL